LHAVRRLHHRSRRWHHPARSAHLIAMSTQPIVERAARTIDPDSWRLHDQGTFPPDHPAAQAVVRGSLATAQRLHDKGLLANTVQAVREAVGRCEKYTRD